MTENMIPFVASWLPFWTPYMLPVFCLCLMGFVGRLILYIFRR